MPYMINHQPPHSVPKPESIQKVDEHRPPQLNKVLCRCRCGCVCSGSREGSSDANTSVPEDRTARQPNRTATHSATNAAIDEDEDVEIQGQEGAEELVETGDLGWYQPQAIERALRRRHQNCWTCVCAAEDPYAPRPDSPGYAGAESAFSSPGAQAGSGPPSLESSMHLSSLGASSAELMCDLERAVADAHTVYPLELSISSFGDNNEFDFW